MSQTSLHQLGRTTLDKLSSTGTTRDLMESTIIAMVWSDFMTGGHDRDEFWRMSRTCAKSTWSKWKKKYPEITAVTDKTRTNLRGWVSDQSPEAARTAVSLKHDSADPTNPRRRRNSATNQ